MEPLNARLNTRIPSRVKNDLEDVARRRHIEASALARALLDEALRREKYPGIVFRTTATGRDAAVEGRRLYIWQVMETVWASDGDVIEASGYLGLRPDQVRAAVDYYSEYPQEVDAQVAANRVEADRGRERWERSRKALRG